MDYELMKFWHVLFNLGEQACLSHDVYGTRVVELPVAPTENFFSINPLKLSRRDENCTSLRNILIEFDHLPLEAQRKLVMESQLPFTSCVFSGSKSYHYIIALDQHVDKPKYRELVKRLQDRLPDMDRSTGNPSRLSRTPGAMRDGVEQSLIYLNPRVKLQALEDWLGPYEQPAVWTASHSSTDPNGRHVLSSFTHYFLRHGAEEGERNRRLFAAACDMLRAGYNPDEIQAKVIRVLDLPPHEIITCINSAAKAVRSERKP